MTESAKFYFSFTEIPVNLILQYCIGKDVFQYFSISISCKATNTEDLKHGDNHGHLTIL